MAHLGQCTRQAPGRLTWEGHKMHTQPTETEPKLCLSVSRGGTDQQQPATGALSAADLGVA